MAHTDSSTTKEILLPLMYIDVLLPYYGDSAHFRAAVNSVLAQEHQAWRLVCVDDCSPGENASEWLRSIGDERIIYVRNKENLGVAKNFAKCLSLVDAPYFVMMGSDDIMLPNHLSELSAVANRNPTVDVFQLGVKVINETGEEAMPLADRVKRFLRPRANASPTILEGEELASSLARGDWAYFPSLMWRTSETAAIGFNEQYDIALDLALLLDVALAGGRLLVFDTVTFAYRRHRTSASMTAARSGERFDQEKQFFLEYAERFRSHNWTRAARIARVHLTSRLNALVELPGSFRVGGASKLVGHIFR